MTKRFVTLALTMLVTMVAWADDYTWDFRYDTSSFSTAYSSNKTALDNAVTAGTWTHPSSKNDRYQIYTELNVEQLSAGEDILEYTSGLYFTGKPTINLETNGKCLLLQKDKTLTIKNLKKDMIVLFRTKSNSSSSGNLERTTNLTEIENGGFTFVNSQSDNKAKVTSNGDITITAKEANINLFYIIVYASDETTVLTKEQVMNPNNETVSTPSLSFNSESNQVTITAGTSSYSHLVTTYYTIDNSNPASSETRISFTDANNSFVISENTSVRAISVSSSSKSSSEASDTYTYTAPVTEINSVDISGLTAPVKGEVLKTLSDLSTSTTGVSISSITWDPTTSPAAASTTYTATIVMEAASGYQFASKVTANDISSKTATVTRTDDTHISVAYTFDETEAEATTYTVTMGDHKYGPLSVSCISEGQTEGQATAGSEITVTAGEATTAGYAVSRVKVVETGTTTEVTVTNNTFIMPSTNVTVAVVYTKVDLSVTPNITGEHGALSFTSNNNPNTKFQIDNTITITVTPDDGYRLKANTLVATYNTDQTLSLTSAGDNQYTFTMPGYDVTVAAEFELETPAITEINSVVIADLDAPIKGAALDTEATCSTDGVSISSITWSPEATTAAASTTYTATIVIEASSGYQFASEVSANAISEKDATITRNSDTQISVAYTFDATAADAISVTANGYSGTFDGAAHGITVTAEGATITYRTTESGDYTQTENPTYTNVGTYTVYYKVSKAGSDDVEGSKIVTIAQKDLTITAKAQAITQGESIATGVEQVNVEGLVENDALTAITLTPSTDEVTTKGTITPSNATTTKGATNYNITYNTGNLTIEAASTNTEEYVSEAKTWTFNYYNTGELGVWDDTNKTYPVTDKLYARRYSSRKFTIEALAENKELTFSDGTSVSVSKVANGAAGGAAGTGNGVTTANSPGTTGNDNTKYVTPFFAFNASVPGTCFVYFSGVVEVKEGNNVTTKSTKCRIYFNKTSDTEVKTNTSVAATSTDPFEVRYTSTEAGSFFIGSMDNTCKIYAIRFVPATTVKVPEGLTGGTVTADKTTANENDEVTLTITPDEGYQLKGGSLKAKYVATNGTETEVTITNNKFTKPAYYVYLTAEFEQTTHVHNFSYTVGSGENTNILTATCQTAGCDLTESKATLTLTANGGTYNGSPFAATTDLDAFNQTTGLSATCSITYTVDNENYTTEAPTNVGNYTAKATITIGETPYILTKTFAISQQSLIITAKDQTITVGGNIAMGVNQVTAEGLVEGDELTGITLEPSSTEAVTTEGTITPSAAQINNGAGNANYNINYVNGNLTITEAQTTTYTLNFSSANESMGSVSVNPTATDNKYEHGAEVTITATAEDGYEFDYWTVDNNKDTEHTTTTLTVTMTADKTVVATFKEKEVVEEQFVNVEKTWYFDEYDEGDYYGTNTNWKVSDKLYARSISDKKFTIVRGESQELRFKDGTKKTVTKYAQANVAGGSSTSKVITAATTGTNDLTPSFAFNTTVPGTCYVLMQEAGSEHNGSYRQRIFFGDGKSAVSSVVSSSVSSLTEIAEISYSAATAGTFVIGSTTNPSNIYAIRFVPTPTYTVKATAGTGGTVSIKDGNGNAITSGSAIAEGTKVVLTATPDAANDYGFKNWTKADGPEVSTDAEYTIASLSEDIDVTANFEQVITYTVTTPEVTGGTVAITVGGKTIASGSKIPAGTEVTVTATPASGYYFVNWGSENLTDNPYTFTPTVSTTLTAKFEAYPGTITYDFMGAYDADKKEIVCTGDETAMLHYIRTDDKSVSTNALFVSTQVLDLNGRISTSENSLTYAEKGITIKSGRAIAIHNLKENDVIRIEFDGELYYAWNNSKSERESNVLADMSTGDMIKTMTPYTVSSINATNNYVVFYTGAATTISQISINEELVLKSVPKPTISSTYTVNEDYYTYTIEYMEGATLYYTLPGGEEQSKSGGESIEVNVTQIGTLTAYAKYGEKTSDEISQRVYAPTPKIEDNGIYDFSKLSESMGNDYYLGTLTASLGEPVNVGDVTLYKADQMTAKTLDRFAFAPNYGEKAQNDWRLLSAGRLRAATKTKKGDNNETILDKDWNDYFAVLNLRQGDYVTFTYNGAELKYMDQSTATLAEGTDVLTSGQSYEVKSDGILMMMIPASEKNCDITKIVITNEETVTAPTLSLKSADTPNVIRLRNGSSSFGNNVVAYYTTDGTEPSATNGTKVEKFPYDITLDETCTVKAIAISETGVTSVTTTVSYIQSEDAETKNEVKELVSVVDENNATVTSVIIGEDMTTVTISAEADGVPVTAIAENLFTVENTATVGAIDLSGTAIAVSGDRSAIPELKNINPATLVYVPSTAVTGTNVVAKTGTGDNATYGCTDYQVYDQKLEEDGLACAVPHDFHADQATLVREFTSNVKCTVCLPYPFKATGGTFYYFKGISDGKVQMQAVEAGATLEANTPYIFEPSSNMGNLSATNVDVAISNAPQTENAEANFTFVGTYKTIVWDNPRGIYGFAAEGTSRGQFVRVGSGASIVACRAYLEYTEGKLNGAATRSANSLPDKLDVEWIPAASNGGTTGIMGTDQQAAADEPVYNLNGQRVDDSYKGLIIKNGKKMVKK